MDHKYEQDTSIRRVSMELPSASTLTGVNTDQPGAGGTPLHKHWLLLAALSGVPRLSFRSRTSSLAWWSTGSTWCSPPCSLQQPVCGSRSAACYSGASPTTASSCSFPLPSCSCGGSFSHPFPPHYTL